MTSLWHTNIFIHLFIPFIPVASIYIYTHPLSGAVLDSGDKAIQKADLVLALSISQSIGEVGN